MDWKSNNYHYSVSKKRKYLTFLFTFDHINNYLKGIWKFVPPARRLLKLRRSTYRRWAQRPHRCISPATPGNISILSSNLFILSETNGAYFKWRLPADVHEEDVVAFHHVLKHLRAGKRPDSRPAQTRDHWCILQSKLRFLRQQHHLVENRDPAAPDETGGQAFDQAHCHGSSPIPPQGGEAVRLRRCRGLKWSIELWNKHGLEW